MVCVLFSRPKHDTTLNYLHYYSKDLVSFSNNLNHKTINKEHTEANKTILSNVILKNKPQLIMLNGHGSSDCVCGHDNEVIISTKENVELLIDTITYCLSCSSASILGKKSVETGAIAFIGYEFDFALGKDSDSEASPRKDKIAKLFLEPSNLLFISLLKGNSTKEAVNKAKSKMVDNVWFLNTTDTFPEAPHYAPFLYGNYLGLTIQGDESASIN